MNKASGARRVNGILSAVITCIFLAHAVMGSLSLAYPLSETFVVLVTSGVVLIVAHLAFCVVTSWQMLTDKGRPPSAKKKRHLMYKWVSGVLLAFVAAAHMSEAGHGQSITASPEHLIVLLFLMAILAIHILFGIKSLLKDVALNKGMKVPLRVAVCAISLGAIVAVALSLWPWQG